MVQDPSDPRSRRTPSYCRPLQDFTRLHRNQEPPQTGESRPVLPPTQRTLSRQIMKKWPPWTTYIDSSSNTSMLEQLSLNTPFTIDSTRWPRHKIWTQFRVQILSTSISTSLGIICRPVNTSLQCFIHTSGLFTGLRERPLILDFTMTHDRFGRSNTYTNGMLTYRLRSTGEPHPDPDGSLNNATQVKNSHYKRRLL